MDNEIWGGTESKTISLKTKCSASSFKQLNEEFQVSRFSLDFTVIHFSIEINQH